MYKSQANVDHGHVVIVAPNAPPTWEGAAKVYQFFIKVSGTGGRMLSA